MGGERLQEERDDWSKTNIQRIGQGKRSCTRCYCLSACCHSRILKSCRCMDSDSDVSELAQLEMVPKRFAGITILEGYKPCSSSLGRLGGHSRCKQIYLFKTIFNSGPHSPSLEEEEQLLVCLSDSVTSVE